MAKLLIVESPGKLKTLRKILGRDWILEASVGHTTELAHDGPKKLGFEFKEGRIETRYVPRGPRGKQVLSKLRAAAKQADQVFLAMDPDREGEAIAWHLVEQLKLKKFSRVAYTQITESAVKAAIQNPRSLDYPLIHAQRARQCLDKLVGYEVSPLLWNTTGGKSAGRVQSATLHLVCERERERLQFKPKDYWTLHSEYKEGFIAKYEALKATLPAAAPSQMVPAAPADAGMVATEQDAKRIEEIAKTHPHVVHAIEDREEKRYPMPPLITSSLQQTAGVRLKYSPHKTMKIAQELYEGVGGNGLITYMRTDAIALSPEFISSARDWLSANAPEALAERPPTFESKADSQGAHEAIRPTSVELTPEKARSLLNQEQFEIYRLIWERAVASQCRPARLAKAQVEILAGPTRWIARGLRVVEPGYLRFWKNIEDEKELPKLAKGQVLNLRGIKVEKKTTQPPPRYSEAKLVQLMEKLGIGRPSTYASTVMTLRERDYVYLEKSGALAPTELGMATDGVLQKAMPDLVDVKFTAQMEESLDKIAEDKLSWESFLSTWNRQYLREALSKARDLIRSLPKMNFAPRASSADGSHEGSGAERETRAKPRRSGDGSKSKSRFTKRRSGASKRRAGSTRTGGASSSMQLGGAARPMAGTSAMVQSVQSSVKAAPSCERGHGPLESRISKKGDPYWKCGVPGCSSWIWSGKS